MLSQMQRLSLEVEGRYATDEELRFIPEFLKTYELRLQTYQKLQDIEPIVIKHVYEIMRSQNQSLFNYGDTDITTKWKRDTLRTWRYSAAALLLDDTETLREQFLLWFQTVMRAFGAQNSCDITYTTMKAVVQKHLTAPQMALLTPILDLNRRLLGSVQ